LKKGLSTGPKKFYRFLLLAPQIWSNAHKQRGIGIGHILKKAIKEAARHFSLRKTPDEATRIGIPLRRPATCQAMLARPLKRDLFRQSMPGSNNLERPFHESYHKTRINEKSIKLFIIIRIGQPNAENPGKIRARARLGVANLTFESIRPACEFAPLAISPLRRTASASDSRRPTL
jgi:hypothetical protein